MSTLIERARRWGEEERAQARLEGRREGMAEGRHEGMAEGRLEGRAEGRAKGRAEGRLEGERALLRHLVARRFGKETLDRLAALLEAPANGVHFAEIVNAAVECDTDEAFVARVTEMATH